MARSIGSTSAIEGLSELSSKLEAVADGLTGERKTRFFQKTMQALGKVGKRLEEAARSNASSQRIPKRVIDSIFTDSRTSAAQRGKTTVIVGVNKRKTMVEWTAGPNPKSPKAKVAPGNKVAMSEATMNEFGTSKMRPKPFMRKAIREANSYLVSEIKENVGPVVEDFAEGRL